MGAEGEEHSLESSVIKKAMPNKAAHANPLPAPSRNPNENSNP